MAPTHSPAKAPAPTVKLHSSQQRVLDGLIAKGLITKQEYEARVASCRKNISRGKQ